LVTGNHLKFTRSIFLPAMRILCISTILGIFSSLVSFSQHIEPCGQHHETLRLEQLFPHLVSQMRADQEALELFTSNREKSGSGDRDQVYVIPVVVHVIHNFGPENISEEQIFDAIHILNRDFRKLNEDVSTVHPSFIGLAADCEIEFKLAKRDPNGNCHNGINRIQSTLTYEGNSAMKALSYWPRNKYFNIWICDNAAGAAGYALLPGSVNNASMASQDGIVLRSDYTGSIGTSSVQRSRTITHEAGHWLNLRHTWGNTNSPNDPGNCNSDDNVADTPNTIGWVVCNINGESCGSLDNVQNYMEYSYCSRMFTQGQRSRMRNALESNTAQRNQLWQTSNLNATGVLEEDFLCKADFSASGIDACVGTAVQFFDESFWGIQSWSWDFGDGNTLEGNNPSIHRNPLHNYALPGTYTVSLTVSDGINIQTKVKQNVITIMPSDFHPVPFFEGFEEGAMNELYSVVNPANDGAWGIAPNVGFSGSRSARLMNFNNNIEFNIDEFISRTYDWSGYTEITITWKWAYANKTTATDDRLYLRTSPDCGNTWFQKKMLRGLTTLPTSPATAVSFVPNGPGQWNETFAVVNVSSQLTPNARFKFEFEGRGGNNIYIDDINISGVLSDGTIVGDIRPEAELLVYPNPSTGQFSVVIDAKSPAEGELIVLDYSGRQVANLFRGMPMGALNFDRTSLSSGMYFLVWRSDYEILTKKLILE
jgi:PKD repeat protein